MWPFKRAKEQASTRCSICGAGDTSAVSHGDANSQAFEAVKPLRSGTITRCTACDRRWYLEPDDGYYLLIPPARMELLERWNAGPQILPPALQKALEAIGATDGEQTPCAVTLKNGEQIDFCLVCIRNTPPVEELPTGDWLLASDIAGIYESPHALPLAIRKASAAATEIRMSVAPTPVLQPGKQDGFLLNWANHFYDGKGEAKDLLLGPAAMLKKLDDYPVYRFEGTITRIAVDPA